MACLFLLCFNTAQRATGSVSVLFDDIVVIMDPDSPDQVIFIKVTFNKMKGLRGDAKFSKTICRNNEDDKMCFIKEFKKKNLRDVETRFHRRS